jgi:hypothetical protein
MFKENKKEIKTSCHFQGLNPRVSVSMQLTVIIAYLNTLQCEGNALHSFNIIYLLKRINHLLSSFTPLPSAFTIISFTFDLGRMTTKQMTVPKVKQLNKMWGELYL